MEQRQASRGQLHCIRTSIPDWADRRRSRTAGLKASPSHRTLIAGGQASREISYVIQTIRTIDAHVGGQPLRLVIEGAPRPRGATPARRREWMRRHADHVRRAVVREPRGHGDLMAAQLADPIAPGAHSGILFMDPLGYPHVSGHGIVAATTIAIERGLFYSREAAGGEVPVVWETTAGPIVARARVHARGETIRVDSVAFTGVPAFVHTPGQIVRVAGRELRVDVAYGGQFCAIVDTEAVGIPLIPSRMPDLRRLGMDIAAAADAAASLVHPSMPPIAGVTAVVFTGPPQDPEAHLRAVAVSSGGVVNRSPSGTGMTAVMAVLDAMGLLPGDAPFVQEGLAGSIFRGRLAGRTLVGDAPAVSIEIEATAWITGEHTFLMDEDDPFRDGWDYRP